MIMAIVGTAAAQDTLDAYDLKSSYLHGQWPDFREECLLMNTAYFDTRDGYPTGVGFDLGIDDTVTVYGMAVGVGTWNMEVVPRPVYDDDMNLVGYFSDSTQYYARLNTMCDTSAYGEDYEMWALYKRVADSVVRVSPQLPVNIKLHAPTYVLKFNSYEDNYCTEHTSPLNVYEVFFNTPVDMAGPFYIGMTHRIQAMGSECGKRYYTWPVWPRIINPGDQIINQDIFFYTEEQNNGQHVIPAHWSFFQFPITFQFPIIAPPDSGYVWDTTVVAGDTVFAAGDTIVIGSNDTIITAGDTTVIVGGDTVFVAGGSAIVCDTTIVNDTIIVLDTAIVGGDTIVYYDTIVYSDTLVTYDILLSITEVATLGRLTAVVPNPAAESARVVASCGMNRVEVVSVTGKRVHEQSVPEGSLSMTLDVNRWPAGTYLVRIHTPLGVSTKKLAVRR